jgi:hypothetical protein
MTGDLYRLREHLTIAAEPEAQPEAEPWVAERNQ